MRTRRIPGVAVAVIAGGKIIREQGYGYSDQARRIPVTPSTLFQAASVSKPVAALGALRLVDLGRLSLDENVNEKLRGWHLPENHFSKDRAVTLRLILCHRAGLTVQGFSPGYPVGAPTPSLVQILDGRPPAKSAAVRVDRLPGSEYRYSGGGYVVMQQMMVDVTDEPFADYMEETVLKPLGMNSSTFVQSLPEAWADRAATGYTGEDRHPIDGGRGVYPELAAAGLWTTAGDLARFYIGVQRSLAGTSNPVVSPAMTRQMLTPQHGNSGLGFMLGGVPQRFGHNGSHAGFDAVTVAFETGEGAVILLNADTDVDAVADVVVEAIGQQYHWPGYPPLP